MTLHILSPEIHHHMHNSFRYQVGNTLTNNVKVRVYQSLDQLHLQVLLLRLQHRLYTIITSPFISLIRRQQLSRWAIRSRLTTNSHHI